MSAERKNRDKAMAAYLKAKGVTRDTGACPWGCGRSIPNGGTALAAHLNTCRGNPRVRPARDVAPGSSRRVPSLRQSVVSAAMWPQDVRGRREVGAA